MDNATSLDIDTEKYLKTCEKILKEIKGNA